MAGNEGEKDIPGNQRRISDASLKNLDPHKFKPGESGNPSGRPKGSGSLSAQLRALLAEVGDEKTGRKRSRIFLEATLLHAVKGNGQAIKEIFARGEDAISMAEVEEFITNVVALINKEFEGEPDRAERLSSQILELLA